MKYISKNLVDRLRKVSRIKYVALLLLIAASWSLEARSELECYAFPEALEVADAQLMADIYSGKISIHSLRPKRAKKNDILWKVYSDRSHNELKLTDQIGAKSVAELDFMEAVYIVEINRKGNMVRVASREFVNGGNRLKNRGWLAVKNLILTNRALSNNDGISKKGLVLLTARSMDEFKIFVEEARINKEKDIKNDEYTYFSAPSCNLTDTLEESKKLEILFVLKEMDGSKLLSLNDDLSELADLNLVEVVKGWMPNINITNWDTRMCLETTYGDFYRKKYEGKEIPIFIEKEKLDIFAKTGRIVDAIIKYEINDERMLASEMRLPILENINGSTVKRVGTLASVNGGSTKSRKAKARAQEICEKFQEKRDNINILFVIDATSSMSKYFPAVQKGVANIVELNKSKYKKSVRFGVSVYRDFEDGPQECVVKPLTPYPQDVYNFLANVKTGSRAKSERESVYNGLIQGVEESGMDPSHTNLVVLIGDAGNHKIDKRGYSAQRVSEVLSRYNANFIAFQVYSTSSFAYTAFNKGSIDLTYGIGKMKNFENLKPVLKQDLNGNKYDLMFQDKVTKETRLFPDGGFAQFTYSSVGTQMPISLLNQSLTESLDSLMASVSRALRGCDGTSAKRNETDDSFVAVEKETWVFLMKQNGMSDEAIEFALKEYPEFSSVGYAETSCYDTGVDCFRPVVYLTHQEVENIMNTFEDIDPNANNTEAKVQIYDALMATVKAYTGETSDERIYSKTLSEIWNIILKIPFDEAERYGDLKEMPLVDFLKSKNAKMKNKFINDFQQSLYKFNKTSLKMDRFTLNGQYYYWVPLSKIPGNAG